MTKSANLSSRSQVVRNRRSMKKRPRKVVSSAIRSKSAHGGPPVMTRAQSHQIPMVNRRKRQTKKRIDIPLLAPGVEVRLPSFPHIALGWRSVSGFLIIAILTSLYLLWSTPVFLLNDPSISGNQRLDISDISKAINLSGQLIFYAIPENISEQFLALFPEIKSIHVEISFPNNLDLVIEERIPEIEWRVDEIIYWVDKDGTAFPQRGQPPELITVQAEGNPVNLSRDNNIGDLSSARTIMSPVMVSGIKTLASHMPESSILVYDQRHGLGWSDERGWRVYFGQDISQINIKMIVYEQIVNKLVGESIIPALISIEYLHAPYYRMEL